MASGVTVQIGGTEQPMFDQVETLWEIVYNPKKSPVSILPPKEKMVGYIWNQTGLIIPSFHTQTNMLRVKNTNFPWETKILPVRI